MEKLKIERKDMAEMPINGLFAGQFFMFSCKSYHITL
jgi:hypothetical protein